MVAKLKLRTRNSQRKRKEAKVKERKDVTRLSGFSSHRGVSSSWCAGRRTLEWRSNNAESDDKKSMAKKLEELKAKKQKERREGLMVS